MRVAIASDHAGFILKEALVEHLVRTSRSVIDNGSSSADPVDYPDFAKKAVACVQNGDADRAILVCGSGMGMAITANRFRGIRAAVLRTSWDAETARRHNDANVACLGARVTTTEDAFALVELFLATPFDGGRHEVRVNKIDE